MSEIGRLLAMGTPVNQATQMITFSEFRAVPLAIVCFCGMLYC